MIWKNLDKSIWNVGTTRLLTSDPQARLIPTARSTSRKLEAVCLGSCVCDLAAMVGVKEASGVEAFRSYFLDVFVKRAYRELDGPLGDLPDGLPPAN